jgi:hypothetical protein
MFFDNLSKMVENANIDWVTHPELDWEYVIIMSKKKGNSFGPHLNLSCKVGNYALYVIPHLDQKEHGFWALANTCTICNA